MKSSLLFLPYRRLVITDTFLEQLIPRRDIKMHFMHPFYQIGVTMRLGNQTGKSLQKREQTVFGDRFLKILKHHPYLPKSKESYTLLFKREIEREVLILIFSNQLIFVNNSSTDFFASP